MPRRIHTYLCRLLLSLFSLVIPRRPSPLGLSRPLYSSSFGGSSLCSCTPGSKAARPRPVTAASIPGLLSLFQNEWDATMTEVFTLKQNLEVVSTPHTHRTRRRRRRKKSRGPHSFLTRSLLSPAVSTLCLSSVCRRHVPLVHLSVSP